MEHASKHLPLRVQYNLRYVGVVSNVLQLLLIRFTHTHTHIHTYLVLHEQIHGETLAKIKLKIGSPMILLWFSKMRAWGGHTPLRSITTCDKNLLPYIVCHI